jgi:SAM-dependent methyltransferase
VPDERVTNEAPLALIRYKEAVKEGFIAKLSELACSAHLVSAVWRELFNEKGAYSMSTEMNKPMPTFDPIQYKQTTKEQWQAAAAAWNRWGPALEQWLGPATELMLDMADIRPGDRVLDLAAGAGGQTLVAARRVGLTGSVLATDLSSNILAFAAQNAQRAGLTNVQTQVMDAENLEFEEGMFDAVICRLGLMFFPDQSKALTGIYRVLKPGGRLASKVFTSAEKNPFFSLPVAIIRRRAQLPLPLPGQPGPFSLGGSGVVERLYQQAGFSDVQVQVVSAPLRLASATECVRFERDSFAALHQMLSGLPETERELAWREIEQELRQFEGPGGFEGKGELIVAVGTK